jgi:hypothetical protein
MYEVVKGGFCKWGWRTFISEKNRDNTAIYYVYFPDASTIKNRIKKLPLIAKISS